MHPIIEFLILIGAASLPIIITIILWTPIIGRIFWPKKEN